MVAHLLATDVHLRLGETSSARKLLLSVSEDSVEPYLQFPYAYRMGLVALACNDLAMKMDAASRLRKQVHEDSTLEYAKTLLDALESD